MRLSVCCALVVLSASSASCATRVDLVYPPSGSTVPLTETCYVIGSVSPANAPLTCNDKPLVPYRTGAFLLMTPVHVGKNTLIFRSGRTRVEHTFLVKGTPSLPTKEILTPHLPAKPLGVLVDEPVELSCGAPAGRRVYAMVGERNLPLWADPSSPTVYKGSVTFSAPVEKVPVLFWSDGLPDAQGGSVTARSIWPVYKVTGKLFEVRARSGVEEGSETLGFLPPAFVFPSNGFDGENIRARFGATQCFVGRPHLALAKSAGTARSLSNPSLPDLSKGYPARPARGKQPKDLLIVVDAGHGGKETGALGPRRTQEKNANLSQAKCIAQALTDAGFRVLMTRNSDKTMDFYERARFAYSKHADAFLSIHHNATPSGSNPAVARSIMTFAWNDRGRALAACIQPRIASIAGIPDQGVQQKSLAVCRNPAVPSCLIEFDFINCPEGEEAIFDPARQKRFAAAVTQGVKDWQLGTPQK